MEKEINKVKIYSTPTCFYCISLKKFLKRTRSFEEINVAADQAAAKEMADCLAKWEFR